jgi:hypothetical protein
MESIAAEARATSKTNMAAGGRQPCVTTVSFDYLQ